MKKALFIDRDGTVIAEPPADYQVDSLEKLEFIPGAISALRTLRGLDFELVMATNQDGLGTEAFPEEDFRPPHEKMLRTLAGEGVAFDDMLIDRTFESDDAPTRKPRTGMFGRYTDGSYDLGTSYVVGDRATDILLARNLGAKGILLAPAAEGRRMLREAGAEEACVLITDSWAEIAEYIRRGERRVVVTRETRETQITVRIDLDGRGFGTCGAAPGDGISTGLRFLDHMLTQIAHHGGVSLTVEAHGDLDIDEHPHDGRRGDRAGRGHRPRPGVEGGHRPLRLRTADGRLPGAGTARLRGAHRLRMGRRIPPRAGRGRPDGDVPPLFPLALLRGTLQPADFGARRERPPQGRGDLQGFRACAAHGRGTHRLRIRHTQQQRHTMIAITDYDTGNLRSVANALRRIGAEFTVTSDAAVLRQADRVLLPGVGEASSAMAKLRERGLDALIPTLTQPVLGICIGMQLMCLDSEEGDTRCLGIFPAHVVRLRGGENPLKIPHVGWDTVGRLRSPLFDGLGEDTYLYYVHSFAAQACDATIAQTDYGGIFSAALGRGNFFGTQFHPEKSGRAGERILRNFLKL